MPFGIALAYSHVVSILGTSYQVPVKLLTGVPEMEIPGMQIPGIELVFFCISPIFIENTQKVKTLNKYNTDN